MKIGKRRTIPGQRETAANSKSTRRRYFALTGPSASRALLFTSYFLLFTFFLGCSPSRFHVEKNLLANKVAPEPAPDVLACYRVGCPDVLEIQVVNRPFLSVRTPIGPDGRLSVPALGKPRIDGLTVREITQQIAQLAGVTPDQVSVRVVEFNSQRLYLFGQVAGLQRGVSYQGPETVLELLQRVGGITAGAEPDEVYVVRSSIA
jgi:protein involved in polysaccharide export with SLBB domain